MSEADYIENWKVTWDSQGSPQIRDLDDHLIATIHDASEDKALARSSLIAAAPGLFDAVIGALEVFQAIAEHAEGPAALAAGDYIPALESALEGAHFLAQVTPEALVGE